MEWLLKEEPCGEQEPEGDRRVLRLKQRGGVPDARRDWLDSSHLVAYVGLRPNLSVEMTGRGYL